ncbi:aminotransferase class I/II-fold pyridoxal phosphate-dependent enzyme [Ekhidna sp.]|uniref:aminotransferase class I/II-fold pyridoxal phosphate-dependent enzyme n=1 Tax=Ekhidna sp. TaxID=2608089 RepID=UPI003297AC8C
MNKQRIYLSPPNFSTVELTEVKKVFNSGWIAPVGPAIDEFEQRLADNYKDKTVLALNSGTSALHLAIILAGVEAGDEVLVSSFTFAACANAILYERAIPVFIDSEEKSWNLDPEILEEYLTDSIKRPKALIVTHLYGMPADIQRIVSIANRFGVKVIEDAAESLGAKFDNVHVGGFGDYGIISFNGNKVITTSGGGALICNKEDWGRAKYLATQANSDSFGYNHKEAGYNYRMSNVLAGIGLAQLTKLKFFIERKRFLYEEYKNHLGTYFDFLDEPNNRFSNRWLTTALLKDEEKSINKLIQYLDSNNIESRQLWKPLHMHEAYSQAPFFGKGTSEQIFTKGFCLPSGTGLTTSQQEFIIEKIKNWFA